MLTKGHLRGILQEEDRLRVLVGQLSAVGREVRSTTMQWAYEGKKFGQHRAAFVVGAALGASVRV